MLTNFKTFLYFCSLYIFGFIDYLATILSCQIHRALGHSEPINHRLWAKFDDHCRFQIRFLRKCWRWLRIHSNWVFYVKAPVLVIKWWGGERRGGVLRRWWRLEIALRWKLIMDVVIIIVNIIIITILTFALGLFFSFPPLLLLPLCRRVSWTGNLENMLSAIFSKYWKKRSGKINQEECLKEK